MAPVLQNIQKKFGLSFPDNFRPLSNRLQLQSTSQSPSTHTNWLLIILIISFTVLLARLFQLQIIQGEKYWQLADGNRIRLVNLPAPRGIIYDRLQQPFVRNLPLFLAKVTRQSGDIEIFPISRDTAIKFEVEGPSIFSDLKPDDQVELVEAVGRETLAGPQSAHLLGYLGEANQQEISPLLHNTVPPSDPTPDCPPLYLGNFIGRGGIEQHYDCWLRGNQGAELVEVNTFGQKTRVIGKKESTPGKNLHLTIDQNLQTIAYQALEGRPGAVVASDPFSGAILALVSSPSFDPNVFNPADPQHQSDRDTKISQLLEDSSRPLFNRAISGAYEPGSTFKIVTATAGLELGKITPDWIYLDTGVETLGTYSYTNWYFTQHGGTEGQINLTRAIARSTDTFFYKLGGMVGVHDLTDYARQFGLGSVSQIDLPGEASGLVPDPAWKIKAKGERWYLGNTYHLAIGQADLLATPLQINLLTNIIASQGHSCPPHVVDYTASNFPNYQKPPTCPMLELDTSNIYTISQGMHQACSPGGTAFPLFDFPVPVACKTGTAQTVGDDTHAWLTVFAPYLPAEDQSYENAQFQDQTFQDYSHLPPISITVLLERGGSGSYDAAPVAGEILDAWYQ
jgi:penicillin-binding protein 2